MPRVKAKKRKIVPILVKRTVDLSTCNNSAATLGLGQKTRREIEEEIGRKVYEFADMRISHTGPFMKEVAVLVHVIDRGGRKYGYE